MQTDSEASLDYLLSLEDKSYKKSLKEFCHHYQIPFIENNVSKTTYDAARIYYKLEEDSANIPDKFNWITSHLSTIPKIEVEDLETTLKMKDKWMKFFMKSVDGQVIDQDRALKNVGSYVVKEYIKDHYQSFTDSNLIRAYELIDDYEK